MTLDQIETVARRFFEALEGEDWTGAVSLISSATLESQAEGWKRRLEGENSDSSLDAASEEVRGPNLISADEYNARLLGPDLTWRVDFPDGKSTDGLLEMSPTELTALYLKACLSPDRIGVVGMRWRVLGSVSDGPDEAHVVFRIREGSYRSPDGETVQPILVPRLLGMHRNEGAWRVSSVPYRDWGVTGWRSTP